MVGFNPCYCWELKDGCVTVGLWTLVQSIIQLAIFGWQTNIVKFERDRTSNRRLPSDWGYSIFDNRLGAGQWTEFYISSEEKWYTALLVVQILHLVSSLFLLLASGALVYGVHTSNKHLVWPWMPCVLAATWASLAYCSVWWAWGVSSYWVALTILQCLFVCINLYGLLCVVVVYRRIARGSVDKGRLVTTITAPPTVYYNAGPVEYRRWEESADGVVRGEWCPQSDRKQ